ncbi:HNH endonuclease [bacterium]|nr:HNH endonuclease [bacterium]
MKIIDYIDCNNDDIISKESKMIANVLLSGSPYQIYNYKQISDEVYNKYGCYIRFNYLDKTASKKNNVASHTVGQYAGEISHLCSKLSLPLISVMIFNGQLPGEGFYTFPLCKELLTQGYSEKEISIEIRNQVAECFENNSWQNLIDHLNKKITDTSYYKEEKEILNQNPETLREKFYQFLVNAGFSVQTPSGNPSTTYDYTKRIERVCKEESLSWEELLTAIDDIVIQYDKGGIKENLGKQSKSAVINALKQYQLFAAEQENKTIISSIIPDTPYYEGNTVERTILQKTRNQEIVKAVKERDNYTCRGCSFHFDNKIVEAHHLIPISNTEEEKQVKKDDLITLCPNCHAIAHILLKRNEKYQKIENLINKLQEIYNISKL